MKTIVRHILSIILSIAIFSLAFLGYAQNSTSPISADAKADPALSAAVILLKRQVCLDFMNDYTKSMDYGFTWQNQSGSIIGLFQSKKTGYPGCGQISLPVIDGSEEASSYKNIISNTDSYEGGMLELISSKLTKQIAMGSENIDYTPFYKACILFHNKISRNPAIQSKFLQSFGAYTADYPLLISKDSEYFKQFEKRVYRAIDQVVRKGCDGSGNNGLADASSYYNGRGVPGAGGLDTGDDYGDAKDIIDVSDTKLATKATSKESSDKLVPTTKSQNMSAEGRGGLWSSSQTHGGSQTPSVTIAKYPYGSGGVLGYGAAGGLTGYGYGNANGSGAFATGNVSASGGARSSSGSGSSGRSGSGSGISTQDPNEELSIDTGIDSDLTPCPSDNPNCKSNGEDTNCPPDDPNCNANTGQAVDCTKDYAGNCIPQVFNGGAYISSTIQRHSAQTGFIYNIPNPGGEFFTRNGLDMTMRCYADQLVCQDIYDSWSNYSENRNLLFNTSLDNFATNPDQLWLDRGRTWSGDYFIDYSLKVNSAKNGSVADRNNKLPYGPMDN